MKCRAKILLRDVQKILPCLEHIIIAECKERSDPCVFIIFAFDGDNINFANGH
jgi:hypothetical protein